MTVLVASSTIAPGSSVKAGEDALGEDWQDRRGVVRCGCVE